MKTLIQSCQTYHIANIHYATLKVLGITGGFIGAGRSTRHAILDAFNRYNWYKLTQRNQNELLA